MKKAISPDINKTDILSFDWAEFSGRHKGKGKHDEERGAYHRTAEISIPHSKISIHEGVRVFNRNFYN